MQNVDYIVVCNFLNCLLLQDFISRLASTNDWSLLQFITFFRDLSFFLIFGAGINIISVRKYSKL